MVGSSRKSSSGIAHQGAGQGHPLLLPAGELAHSAAPFLVELHLGDDRVDSRPAVIEAPEQPQSFLDRQLLGELGFLQRHPDPGPEIGGIGRPLAAEHGDSPGVGLGETFADLDRRGLPRAVGTQEAEALPGLDLEVEAINRAGLSVELSEPVDGNGGWNRHGGARLGSGNRAAGLIPEEHQLASTFKDPYLGIEERLVPRRRA